MKKKLWPLLLVVTFACESLAAADLGYPSDSQIAVEMQKIEQQRKDMFSQDTVIHPPVAMAPSVPLPVLQQQRVDVLEIAKQYEAKAAAKPAKPQELVVFVSFSLPEEYLKQIAADVGRAGGVLVLQGFKDGNMRATVTAIRDMGLDVATFQINPPAFERYQVKTVPTMLLARPEAATQLDGAGCSLPDTYVSVSGATSLEFALNRISAQSKPFAYTAQKYLDKLHGPS